jgi:5-methylcytosine-specific restriction endonuclease McrA
VTEHPSSKVCNECKEDKPLELFHRRKNGRYGRHSRCAECVNAKINEYNRNKYRDNEEFRRKKLERTSSYKKNNPDKVRSWWRKYRTKKREAWVEDVYDELVYARCGWVCMLCGERVDPKITGEMGKSLDHIIPISRGGEHSYANTQLAHLVCNKRKNDRLVHMV